MAKAQARNDKDTGHNPAAFKSAMKNAGMNAWKKARSEAPAPRFGERLPTGRYEAKLTKMVCGEQDFVKDLGKGKKQTIKVPSIRFNFLITEGEQKGANVAKFIRLRPEDVEWSELDYKDLSESLQNLDYEIAQDDLSKVLDIAEEVNKEQPDVFIYAGKVKTYKKRDGSDGDSQQININGLNNDAPPADETEESGEEENEEGVDVNALAEIADDSENEEAEDKQRELAEIAAQYDLDPDKYDTWTDLAEAIGAAVEEAPEEEQEEEEAEPEPAPKKPVKKKPAPKQPVKKGVKKKGR